MAAARHFAWDVPWQGLKPILFSLFSARLKSCPDTKQDFYVARKLFPEAKSSSHAGSLEAPEGILFYRCIREFRGQKKRTSAAKAGHSGVIYGTAEAVPFQEDSVLTQTL